MAVSWREAPQQRLFFGGFLEALARVASLVDPTHPNVDSPGGKFRYGSPGQTLSVQLQTILSSFLNHNFLRLRASTVAAAGAGPDPKATPKGRMSRHWGGKKKKSRGKGTKGGKGNAGKGKGAAAAKGAAGKKERGMGKRKPTMRRQSAM